MIFYEKKKIKNFSIGINREHVCSIRSTTNKHDWNLIFWHFASLNWLAFQWMALVRLNTVTVTYYCSAFQLRLQKCNRLKFRALALVNNRDFSNRISVYRCAEELQNGKMHNLIFRLASFAYLHWRIPENMNFVILFVHSKIYFWNFFTGK